MQDIMNEEKNYTYYTKIDLPLFFHCFMLDAVLKELCTINTPFGLYQFNILPQEAKITPGLAQAITELIVKDINVDAYMDDYYLFTNKDFEYHVDLIDKLLSILAAAGMKCCPLKSAWAVQETSFLSYWTTPTAVKTMKKKIDVILKVDQPES